MPTDVVSSIGTGGTYSTVQAWEDASPASLVTADQRWIGELKNQTFTAGVTISGTTVDSTRYAILRCATGASFRDNVTSAGPLKYDETKGAAIRTSAAIPVSVDQSYTQLYGLQARRTSFDLAYDVSSSSTNVTVDSCVGSSSDRVFASRQPSNLIKNCLFIQEGGTSNAISVQGQFFSCTIVRNTTSGGQGVNSGYSSLLLKNCAVFGFTTVFGGTLKTGSQYNATDGAAIGGNTGDVTSLTYSSQFESSTNDFRAKSTGGLKAGTPDATNAPTDILGQTRGATTPYIGAWEVVAAGGTTYTSSLSGSLAASATLARRPGKALAGSPTAAGSLARQVAKPLAGTLTAGATLARRCGKALSGTLAGSGTLTASGSAVARSTGKALAGTLAASGSLSRRAAKALAGSASASATFAAARAVLMALSGTLTASGSLARSTGKALVGALTASGSIRKAIAKGLAGLMTASGSFLKSIGGLVLDTSRHPDPSRSSGTRRGPDPSRSVARRGQD